VPTAARAQGKRIGRPALDPALQRKIAKQLGAGIAQTNHIGVG
jgi:hypothetical protein